MTAGHEVTFKAALTFRLEDGRPQHDAVMTEAETVLDALAAELGQQNGSQSPLRLTLGLEEDASTYVCVLVDDA